MKYVNGTQCFSREKFLNNKKNETKQIRQNLENCCIWVMSVCKFIILSPPLFVILNIFKSVILVR